MALLKIIKEKNNKIYEYNFDDSLKLGDKYDFIAEKLSELDINCIRITCNFCRFYTNNEIEVKLLNYFGNSIKTTFENNNFKYAYELRFDDKKQLF